MNQVIKEHKKNNSKLSISDSIQKLREFVSEIVTPEIHPEAFRRPDLKYRINKRTLAVGSLVINFLGLALPLLSLQIYDRILVHQSIGTLRVLTIGLLMAVAIETMLRLARAYLINWAGSIYEHVLSCNTMRHFLVSDLSEIDKKNVGEHLQNFSAVSRLREFFSGQILMTLVDLPFVFVYLFLIWYLAGWLVVVPLCLLGVFGTIGWLDGNSMKRLISQKDEQDENRYNLIIETLSGIHTVKSFGLENQFIRKYEKVMADSSRIHYSYSKENNASTTNGVLFTQIMSACIIAVGSFLALKGLLTLGVLIACVLLAGRIMQPVHSALLLRSKYQDFQIASEKLRQIFELKEIEKFDNSVNVINEGMLDLKKVSFRFSNSDEYLLKEISLKMKRGDCISISGKNGGGKTVLMKLIAGLFPPEEGEILVNGFPSSRFHSSALSQSIGYLPMEGVIFNGTIRENITSFGETPEDKAMDVARLMGIDDEIKLLPEGYETKITGGMADVVPPGLKQRIALTRSLAPKPRIILFNNADRALDTDGYNKMFRLLGRLKGKVTMIIVSDDQSFIGLADRKYTLENGKILLVNEKKLYSMTSSKEVAL